jgi:1A family penicillin-binding protein
MQKYRNYPHYKPASSHSKKRAKAARYPAWMNHIPLFQKFMRLPRHRKIILGVWSGVSVLAVITIFTTVYFASSLGSKESIMNRNKTGVTLTDVNGKPFYEFYNATSNSYVPLSKISKTTRQAVISSEDKDFYKHGGFSVPGILNAVWQNVRPGGIDSGGSTITQQLVKNALLTKQRSLLRKYQEIVLSVEIERRYSKDEILEMYLNSVYFGEGAFGIQDAAKTYFNTSASKLDTAQAATLVGLLPAPSAYSPISGDSKKTEVRQDYVLGRMVEDGYISKSDSKLADNEKLSYSKQQNSDFQAPHFALMVKSALDKQYGEQYVARSGMKVKTTLNLDWQKQAENAVSNQVAALAGNNVSNGSAVVIDTKNGEVRALVGSVDWSDNKFGKVNMATANRQPGSSFKPLVYGTGIEKKEITAATIFEDKPTTYPDGYSPKNYDLSYHGNVTTRYSLGNSLNIPAVKALDQVGIPAVVSQARKLGLSTLKDANNYGLSFALGASDAKLTEMTNAYATFANQGLKNNLTIYTSIIDKNNREIFKAKPQPKRAISDETSYILSSILSDNATRVGTFGSSLQIDRPAAAKTGTTENFRDAWTIGYTPSVAVGVWIGNNDGTLMDSVAGSLGAAPIWRSIMYSVNAGKPVEQFKQPSTILVRDICRADGGLATKAGINTVKEYFRPGTLPTNSCEAKQKEKPKKDKPKKTKKEDTQTTTEPTPTEPPADTTPNCDPNQGPVDPSCDTTTTPPDTTTNSSPSANLGNGRLKKA